MSFFRALLASARVLCAIRINPKLFGCTLNPKMCIIFGIALNPKAYQKERYSHVSSNQCTFRSCRLLFRRCSRLDVFACLSEPVRASEYNTAPNVEQNRSQCFDYSPVSVIVYSWRHDVSVDMVVSSIIQCNPSLFQVGLGVLLVFFLRMLPRAKCQEKKWVRLFISMNALYKAAGPA